MTNGVFAMQIDVVPPPFMGIIHWHLVLDTAERPGL
jgi:hypothetical protein